VVSSALSETDTTMERIPFTCTLDCAAHCELVACVQDGRLIRIDASTDKADTTELPRLVPCLKGRGQGRLLSASERVLTPLRRVGPRGSDDFEEVTWDEALDYVADRLTETRDLHGAEAVLHLAGAGSLGGRGFSGAAASGRFFSHWGSATGTAGHMSAWCNNLVNGWMTGGTDDAIDVSALFESKLIILWGMNPAENRHGVNLAHFIAQARDRGTRVLLIDPRYTDSAVLADQWIPIRPGTDVALIAAIAHVWISEGLADEAFMASHTVGYSDYCAYVKGDADGVPKSPEWAESITMVPANTIRSLARVYAEATPALILAGLGPQRSRYGEQTERALHTLACMSGNVGLCGGGLVHRGRHSSASIGLGALPAGPLKPARTVRAENWGRFLLDGSLQPPVKMAYIVAANAINRSSGTLANARALEGLDTVVVQDPYFTPTARYADIVLPICLDLERPDMVGAGSEVFYNRQIVAAPGETRTDYWVFSKLAERLGFGENYTCGRTEEEWLLHLLDASSLDVDALQRDGVIRVTGGPMPRMADFRIDPIKNPLKTSSGLIEITCEQAVENGLPRVPAYIENPSDNEADLPLQLVTPHCKLRANSTGYPNPWLLRLEPHRVWMNPGDAATREIGQGDLVEVHNASGTVAIPAKLTERIAPGVVCVYQGSWYDPGPDGVDTGGCSNTLTSHRVSPTGGMAIHSEWVQVKRRQG
jgi:anaerobic dimethyl sulfoxide reductase subunit A